VRTTRMADVVGVPLQLQKDHHGRECVFLHHINGLFATPQN